MNPLFSTDVCDAVCARCLCAVEGSYVGGNARIKLAKGSASKGAASTSLVTKKVTGSSSSSSATFIPVDDRPQDYSLPVARRQIVVLSGTYAEDELRNSMMGYMRCVGFTIMDDRSFNAAFKPSEQAEPTSTIHVVETVLLRCVFSLALSHTLRTSLTLRTCACTGLKSMATSLFQSLATLSQRRARSKGWWNHLALLGNRSAC